jgi:hypothetical protein
MVPQQIAVTGPKEHYPVMSKGFITINEKW